MSPKKHNPNEGEDRARLMIALVLSIAILFGFHFFITKPQMEKMKQQQMVASQQGADQKNSATKSVSELASGMTLADKNTAPFIKDAKPLSRAENLAQDVRIPIVGHGLVGTLSLTGLRLDDLSLTEHHKTVAEKENVELFVPAGTIGSYYVESGWLSTQEGLELPSENTQWALSPNSPRQIKAGGDPVILQWANTQGILFEKSIALDNRFLFTIKQRVYNKSSQDIHLNTYQLAARSSLPVDYSGFFVLHEGPIGFLNGESYDPSYNSLKKGKSVEENNVSGWVGFTDKYWMVSLLPDPKAQVDARMMAEVQKDKNKIVYQADVVSKEKVATAGGSIENVSYVFAGVKELDTLQGYQDTFGFDNLEYGIDFGMWYLITKPFYYILHWLHSFTGSIALAIILMTLLVRGALFPLANKSFVSMARMKTVTPMVKELQTKYKDDKAKMQMEIYELYRRENVNPFSGCWPMMVQIPIFFALYKTLLISVELRHAPFWGWISDLSAPDPTTVFNLFGLIPWEPPQLLMIGGWPLLFGLSMIMQKRISPPIADPTQDMIQNYFPFVFTVMMAHFPVGLVIYWAWSNTLATLQQYYILKKVGGEDTSLILGHSGRRQKKKNKKKENGKVIEGKVVDRK